MVSEAERVRLADALHECVEIARTYRHTVADEDSIVLIQNLQEMGAILGIEVPPDQRPSPMKVRSAQG